MVDSLDNQSWNDLSVGKIGMWTGEHARHAQRGLKETKKSSEGSRRKVGRKGEHFHSVFFFFCNMFESSRMIYCIAALKKDSTSSICAQAEWKKKSNTKDFFVFCVAGRRAQHIQSMRTTHEVRNSIYRIDTLTDTPWTFCWFRYQTFFDGCSTTAEFETVSIERVQSARLKLQGQPVRRQRLVRLLCADLAWK